MGNRHTGRIHGNRGCLAIAFTKQGIATIAVQFLPSIALLAVAVEVRARLPIGAARLSTPLGVPRGE